MLGEPDRHDAGHLLELARDRLGRGLDGLLPLVQMIAEAEMIAAEAAIGDAPGMLVDRGDVGRADVAGLIDPDRRDAGGFQIIVREIVLVAPLAHSKA